MYENPDGFLMADHEKRQVPPVTLPVQERHKVYPPADHDKLAWCRETIVSIDLRIDRLKQEFSAMKSEAYIVTLNMQSRLGNRERDSSLWGLLRSTDERRRHRQPLRGTWDDVFSLDMQWQHYDDQANILAIRLLDLRAKRLRCRSICCELESNIEHWEGV